MGMSILHEWASEWGVSPHALADLARRFDPGPPVATCGSEGAAQTLVRLEASRLGYRLFRNNTGAFQDESGRWIRYGLANDSKRMNESMKSSDLIGIGPTGQFVAREIKAPGWKYSPNDKRAVAQLNFLTLIDSLGGNACFATGEGTL
jgi:hypothetical protein